jgi:hypothetical protein
LKKVTVCKSFITKNIESNNDYDIKVISLEGKIIKEMQSNNSGEAIRIEAVSLTSGNYFVEIYNNHLPKR